MTTSAPRIKPARPGPPRADGDLVREAFRRRANKAVEQIAQSASLETLTTALAAATDFGAVASALGGGAIPPTALDLDPFADAIARGVAERDRLAAEAGGLLSATEIGQALGITRQAVDKRRANHQLLAVRVAGDWRYPAIQFDTHGEAPPQFSALLEKCAALHMSGWSTLGYLLAPDTVLGGLTPLEALRRRGPEARDVLRQLMASEIDSFG